VEIERKCTQTQKKGFWKKRTHKSLVCPVATSLRAPKVRTMAGEKGGRHANPDRKKNSKEHTAEKKSIKYSLGKRKWRNGRSQAVKIDLWGTLKESSITKLITSRKSTRSGKL